MKKYRKLVAVLCLVCLLLPLLCGCNALDKMREKQAFFDAEGNILWNGKVYKKLPSGEDFCPEWDGGQICVTEEDVPVLLSNVCADSFYDIYEDGLFLEYQGFYEITGEEHFYCREDRYEEFAKKLQEGFAVDVVCALVEHYCKNLAAFVGNLV